MARDTDIKAAAGKRIIDCAVEYVPVTYTDGLFIPVGGGNIRAVHVNTDGTMVLRSLAGHNASFAVVGGSTYAYAASAIVEAGTDAELVALF